MVSGSDVAKLMVEAFATHLLPVNHRQTLADNLAGWYWALNLTIFDDTAYLQWNFENETETIDCRKHIFLHPQKDNQRLLGIYRQQTQTSVDYSTYNYGLLVRNQVVAH